MAHSNPQAHRAEQGQRQHAGRESQYTDAGVKAGGQGTAGTGRADAKPKDDVHSAPESGDKQPDSAKTSHRAARGFDQG